MVIWRRKKRKAVLEGLRDLQRAYPERVERLEDMCIYAEYGLERRRLGDEYLERARSICEDGRR